MRLTLLSIANPAGLKSKFRSFELPSFSVFILAFRRETKDRCGRLLSEAQCIKQRNHLNDRQKHDPEMDIFQD